MKGWKTLAWSVFVAAVGVIQTFDFTTIIPPNQQWTGSVLMAIGAVTAALRYVTTTPVGKSE